VSQKPVLQKQWVD